MKKQSDLSRLMGYAGNYRRFTYVSWALSAVSALVPFVYIWKILRDVLNAAPDYAQAVNIPRYGWMEVSQINPEKLMILYSIVFQDVTLFDNTILENIRLGRKGATDKDIGIVPGCEPCGTTYDKSRRFLVTAYTCKVQFPINNIL